MRTKIFAPPVWALLLLAVLLTACAGTPGRTSDRGGEERDRPTRNTFDAVTRALEALDRALEIAPGDAQALRSRADFLVKAGDAAGAFADLQRALSTSTARRDARFRASLYYMAAWTRMISEDEEGSREYMDQAVRTDPALAGLAPVLEFRLIASEKGPEEARRYADAVLADLSTRDLTAEILSVLTGSKDVRDLRYESDAQASEYALYLSGYRVEPDPVTAPADLPPPSADAPVVALGNPQSVGADEKVLAVAKLAFRDALIKEGAFRVVDSDSRRSAVEELELSLSAASAGERDQALGGLFAADFVASGSVVRSETGWLIAYTLSSGSDGTILASEFASAPDYDSIQALAGRFASSLGGMARAGRLGRGSPGKP